MAWKSFRARKLPADQPLLHSPCWAAHHVQEVVCAEQIYPNTLLGKGRNPSLPFHAWEIAALSWGSAVTKSTQQTFFLTPQGKSWPPVQCMTPSTAQKNKHILKGALQGSRPGFFSSKWIPRLGNSPENQGKGSLICWELDRLKIIKFISDRTKNSRSKRCQWVTKHSESQQTPPNKTQVRPNEIFCFHNLKAWFVVVSKSFTDLQ